MLKMDKWLRTWEWGWIRIADSDETAFATYLRDDAFGEYSYYRFNNGEVVAEHNWEDE